MDFHFTQQELQDDLTEALSWLNVGYLHQDDISYHEVAADVILELQRLANERWLRIKNEGQQS